MTKLGLARHYVRVAEAVLTHVFGAGAASAPVATPLHWAELSDRRLDPQGWTVTTIGERLAGVGDPRSGLAGHASGLGPARGAQERCYA